MHTDSGGRRTIDERTPIPTQRRTRREESTVLHRVVSRAPDGTIAGERHRRDGGDWMSCSVVGWNGAANCIGDPTRSSWCFRCSPFARDSTAPALSERTPFPSNDDDEVPTHMPSCSRPGSFCSTGVHTPLFPGPHRIPICRDFTRIVFMWRFVWVRRGARLNRRISMGVLYLGFCCCMVGGGVGV